MKTKLISLSHPGPD